MTGHRCLRVNSIAVFAIAALLGDFYCLAAPFQNGSFESPGGPSDAYILLDPPNDSLVTGWINSGGRQVYQTFNNDLVVPRDGNFYVSFGHSMNGGGSLAQTFDTIAGQQYSVTYHVTQQQGIDNNQYVRVEALDGSTPLASVLFNVPPYSSGTHEWFEGTPLVFTAGSNSTTLRFVDATVVIAQPSNWGLDLIEVSVTVPEPGMAVLMLSGIGILAVGWRRKSD